MKNTLIHDILFFRAIFDMKFAGKRRKSTEGVTLSGAGHTGATVNGSTLWRHPDEPGAEGATYVFV